MQPLKGYFLRRGRDEAAAGYRMQHQHPSVTPLQTVTEDVDM